MRISLIPVIIVIKVFEGDMVNNFFMMMTHELNYFYDYDYYQD